MSWWFTEFTRTISQTDPTVIGISIALLTFGAVFATWRSWHNLHNARTIEDIPTAKARSAHQGYVELEGVGKLMDGPPILAPLSGLPSVWYRYRIEELRTTYLKGRTRRRWVTVEKGESTEVFWFEDDTGRVAIDPEGAEVTPKHKDVWRSAGGLRGFATRPASIVKFLTTHPSGNSYRFTEERINPGDTVYALGLLKNLGSHVGGPTVDEEVRQLLREWKQNQATLKQRFDLNEDGKIDQKEWRLARSQARREVLQSRRGESKHFSEGINLLTRTNDRNRPYLISAYTQQYLVKRYRHWALLYGVGFFLVGGAGVWLLNTRFG